MLRIVNLPCGLTTVSNGLGDVLGEVGLKCEGIIIFVRLQIDVDSIVKHMLVNRFPQMMSLSVLYFLLIVIKRQQISFHIEGALQDATQVGDARVLSHGDGLRAIACQGHGQGQARGALSEVVEGDHGSYSFRFLFNYKSSELIGARISKNPLNRAIPAILCTN